MLLVALFTLVTVEDCCVIDGRCRTVLDAASALDATTFCGLNVVDVCTRDMPLVTLDVLSTKTGFLEMTVFVST